MAALDPSYPTYITGDVYSMLLEWAKLGGEEPRRDMWTDLGTSSLGYRIYGSSWSWEA
mgnify:FL=1